ncbi:MAG: PAS domain S-box protein, partial [Bacteroidetes bacterium]
MILLGMLLPHAVWAQRYPFDVYSIDEGLAQSQPLSIYQSRNGYLWIGTLGGGVSRFDGRVFTNFGKRDGLPSGIVYGFAEDASGVLWVATGEGAARYDGRTFEPVELGLPPQRLLSAAVDGQGNVWFGTEASGLVRLGPSDTTRIADGLPDPKVLALLPDGEALWIGTTAGVCRYEGGALHCFSGDEGLPDTYVGELVRDAQGTLWAGTGKGLFRYAGDRFERVHPEVFEGHRISALAADRKGGIWVGTDQELIRIDGDDLVRYSRENGLIRPVLSLFEDEEGNLWIGLDGAGLARFAPSPFLLFTTEHGLAEDGAWSILEDRQGRIWLGTGNGLSRFDGQAFETFTTGDGLPGNTVYALFEDPDGTIWVGTEEGLARYDGARFHPIPEIAVSVWALARDPRSGALWVGTGGQGLYRYHGKVVERFTAANGLPDMAINVLLVTRDSTLWVGTRKGLVAFRDGLFATFTTEDGLPHNDVSALREDAYGALWVGTYGGGIARFVPPHRPGGPSFSTLGLEDGLPDDHIMSILTGPGGDIWFCTNQGLSRVDLAQWVGTGEAVLEHFGVAEGFVGRECNVGAAFRDRAGHLWFGTVRGVMRYTPGQRLDNPYPPRVLITSVRLFFGQEDWTPYAEGIQPGTALPAGLRLPYNKNSVTFDFVGINLTQPREVAYQYRLEGADEAWTPVTRETSATYANLPPGEYTFLVRAVNGSGVWSETPAAFHFVITPPFWRTPWFYLFGALLCFGAVYAVMRRREHNLRRSRERLEAMVETRTHELLQEKEKVEEANEKLRLLSLVVRETDNVVIIADRDGEIIWINEALTRAAGYTLETLRQHVGSNLRDIYRNPALEAALERAVREKASSVFESKLYKPDGTEIWVSSTLSPITDDRGEVTRLVVIDTDITERKQLEQELVAAREAALEAARAKSAFLANMSHEIRTPMNGVIGMTSLLLDTDLTPEQREFVEVIRNSGDALLAIINEILDFSKIEAGKIDLEEQDFSIQQVVEEALELVTMKAAEKHLELVYLIEEGVPPMVRGDMTRLRQILTNLLSNAVKFTEEGEVSVRMDAERLPSGRYRIHTAVQDTGIGIPSDRMHRLFEAFSQVDASTTRR